MISVYYNFILDETGDFSSRKSNLKSAIVGVCLKSETKLDEVDIYNFIKNDFYEKLKLQVNAKFDKLHFTNLFGNEKKLMVKFYSDNLDSLASKLNLKWNLVAFESARDKKGKLLSVMDSIPGSEGTAFNYINTFAEGTVFSWLQSYYTDATIPQFNIYIASRVYNKNYNTDISKYNHGITSIDNYRTAIGMFAKNVVKDKLLTDCLHHIKIKILHGYIECYGLKAERKFFLQDKDKNDVVQQILISIADAFANIYNNDIGKSLEYNVVRINDKDNALLIDCYRSLSNSAYYSNIIENIIFPSINMHETAKTDNSKDLYWNKKYDEIQEQYNGVLQTLAIKVSNLTDIKRTGFINEIISKLETRYRLSAKRDYIKKDIKRLQSLVRFCHMIPNWENDVAVMYLLNNINLFLIHKYQNQGMLVEAEKIMKDSTMATHESEWRLKHILELNSLVDSFEYNKLDKLYRNKNTGFLGDLEKLNKLYPDIARSIDIGKAYSIYLSSMLTRSKKEDYGSDNEKDRWELAEKIYKKALEYFSVGDNIRNFDYVRSNFFRIALAEEKLRIAEKIIFETAKQVSPLDGTRGNWSLKSKLGISQSVYRTRVASIIHDEFNDFKQDEELNQFLLLNFLTLLRDLAQKEINITGADGISDYKFLWDSWKEWLNLQVKIRNGSVGLLKEEFQPHMGRGIYPICVVIWRLAQVYRYSSENKMPWQTGKEKNTKELYEYALEYFSGNDSTYRILIIKLAILADYILYLLEILSDVRYNSGSLERVDIDYIENVYNDLRDSYEKAKTMPDLKNDILAIHMNILPNTINHILAKCNNNDFLSLKDYIRYEYYNKQEDLPNKNDLDRLVESLIKITKAVPEYY